MKLIDLIDNKLVISPECLVISPFSEMWERDKSKDKSLSTNQIKYIWFFTDFNSPYHVHPEEQRKQMILSDIIKDKSFKVNKEIEQGVNKYKELHLTASMTLLDAATSAIYKMEEYFKNVDYTTDDPDKVQKMIINMPKLITSINEAKKQCQQEQTSGVKVRGGADVGLFED